MTKKIKLVWISFFIRPPVIEILNKLTEHNFEVIAYSKTPQKNSIDESALKYKKFKITFIPLKYFPAVTAFLFSLLIPLIIFYIILVERPRFIMIQPDPSIVFSVFWKPFANKFGIRTILDSRSIPVEVVNFWKKIDQLFYNVSIVLAKKYFDGISVLTYQMKLNICQRFNIKEDFIGVWGSGVSVELFEPDKYTENNLRADLGLDHKFIIFYHGTMGVKRGLIESVYAINLLKGINDDITLFFLGEGDSRPIIEKLIYKYNLQNKIIIHDVVDFEEVPKFISICDTGIVPLPDMPDWRHQEPLKILEYLSMEKPIILTDISAHRHIIGDNKCGIFISSANPMDISKGIKYAYDNRDKIKEWGQNGRRIVMNNYTWEKVSEDLIDFLFNILNN